MAQRTFHFSTQLMFAILTRRSLLIGLWVEPFDVEKSADSVRVLDDVRRALEHVKRIAEVCVDEVGWRK